MQAKAGKKGHWITWQGRHKFISGAGKDGQYDNHPGVHGAAKVKAKAKSKVAISKASVVVKKRTQPKVRTAVKSPKKSATSTPKHGKIENASKLNPDHSEARPKAKASPGSIVGGPEHGYATHQEHHLAHKIEAKHVGRRNGKDQPFDALKRGDDGKRHAIEVKTMMKGSKKNISVHDDALARKVSYATKRPNRVVHTVVNDHRDTYSGGDFKGNHSGHDLYYKRGAGAYKLSEMHKVKDHAELHGLIHAKDSELPMAARAGKDWIRQTTSVRARAQLEKKAKAAHASRLNKDRELKRKAKKAREAQGV